jgi:hypothetical protein
MLVALQKFTWVEKEYVLTCLDTGIAETVDELPMLVNSFLRELPQLYNIAFFRNYHSAILAVRGNLRLSFGRSW